MKVTVLVTTYNHEKFIAQAIESVLAQETRFEYEVVIIEDCSTDSTRDIVTGFRDSYPDRIRLVLAERNRNDNRAWGDEVLNCRSEYIALLDGDDYWTSPHKLQKQVDFLDSHPECTICCHNAEVFYDDGSRQPYDFNQAGQKVISTLDDLWEANHIAGCSAMLRGGVVGRFPDWFYPLQWGDWELYILWAHYGKIGYINEVLGAYRIHSGGAWSGLGEIQQLERLIEFYRKMNANLGFKYNERIRGMIAKRYYHLALAYEKQGDLFTARAMLRNSAAESHLIQEREKDDGVRLTGPVKELGVLNNTTVRNSSSPSGPYFRGRAVGFGPLARTMASLTHTRDLLRELVARDIKLRYKRSILGIGWSLLVPLAQLLVLYIVFNNLLPLDIPNYTTFLFAGILPWTWFHSSLLAASGTIIDNREMVRQVGFPVAVLPTIAVTSQLIHFLLSLPILAVFLAFDGYRLSAAILALPVVMSIQFMFTLGLAYIVSTFQVAFRDTQYLLGILLFLFFYLTPVFYDDALVPASARPFYQLNPMVHLLGAYRAIFIRGEAPASLPLLTLSVLSGALLMLGYAVFMRARNQFVEEL
jgi:lipopolysaccharide transport system permease protein